MPMTRKQRINNWPIFPSNQRCSDSKSMTRSAMASKVGNLRQWGFYLTHLQSATELCRIQLNYIKRRDRIDEQPASELTQHGFDMWIFYKKSCCSTITVSLGSINTIKWYSNTSSAKCSIFDLRGLFRTEYLPRSLENQQFRRFYKIN